MLEVPDGRRVPRTELDVIILLTNKFIVNNNNNNNNKVQDVEGVPLTELDVIILLTNKFIININNNNNNKVPDRGGRQAHMVASPAHMVARSWLTWLFINRARSFLFLMPDSR